MAGDWIKMRVDLWDDPRVVRILSALDADKAQTCGALFRTWSLFDQYTEDGRLEGYTAEVLDVAVGINGWSKALESVGWLEIRGNAVIVPRFDEHNGASAKRRATDRNRKKRVRKTSASQADEIRTREEKRREEEKGSADADVPADLLMLIDGWNSLGDGIVKKGNGANRKPPSKALTQGWKKMLREPELRAAFADIPKLLDAIRNALYCHDQDWFSLTWLFGKNQDGEWKAVKLLNGGYDKARTQSGDPERKVIGTPAPLPERSNRVQSTLRGKTQP